MSILIITIPLLCAITINNFSKFIGKEGGKIIGGLGIIINTIISISILKEEIKENIIKKITIKEWIEVGGINTKIELIINKETIIMATLISIITMIVIIYSIYYMSEDSKRNTFLSKLLLFSVTMYILVLSNNILVLFIGWEGVGIMSFLLINYWNTSLNSNKSAIKAILLNKIGDIGVLLAIIILYNIPIFSGSNITSLTPLVDGDLVGQNSIINFIKIGFIIAAMAKSAQIFLHGWLGDAMAGPTPVSALLHAATMVTAGIYLLLRVYEPINFIGNENILNKYIIFIGVLTILYAGFTAIFQKDIKKIIAYSTCSQIGYMFINFGFAFNNNFSSLFHLFTHGFFKALLFLSSGIIIHNFLNDQDLRKFGSFLFKFPLTYLFFLVGSFSIIGFPFLSGYYSKENIILYSFFNSPFIALALFFGAILTCFYSFSLLFRTFFSFSNGSSLSFFNFTRSKGPTISYEISIYNNPNYYYFFFSFLLFGSICLGFFSKDFFLVLNSSSFSSFLDVEFFPLVPFAINWPLLPIIALFIIFTLFLFYLFLPNFYFAFNPYFIAFFNFFNRKAFFDSFFNYFFSFPVLWISYNISFKLIDRGFLEYFGPLGLFRLFFYFPLNYNIYKHYFSDSSVNFLFIYLVLSFLFLFFFFSFLI